MSTIGDDTTAMNHCN